MNPVCLSDCNNPAIVESLAGGLEAAGRRQRLRRPHQAVRARRRRALGAPLRRGEPSIPFLPPQREVRANGARADYRLQ